MKLKTFSSNSVSSNIAYRMNKNATISSKTDIHKFILFIKIKMNLTLNDFLYPVLKNIILKLFNSVDIQLIPLFYLLFSKKTLLFSSKNHLIR